MTGQSVDEHEKTTSWEGHGRVPCFLRLPQCGNDFNTTAPTVTTMTGTQCVHCRQRVCNRGTLQPACSLEHPVDSRQHGHRRHHHQRHRCLRQNSQQHHHQHHHPRHHHNEVHSCSYRHSTSTCRWRTIAPFSSQVSLNGLLKMVVFLLYWAAVCAAPRRTLEDSITRFNPTSNNLTNFLPIGRSESHKVASISSFDSTIPKFRSTPLKLPETDNIRKTTASKLQSASASFLSPASLSRSVESNAKTGRGPYKTVDELIMDSGSQIPGGFPALMSHRVAFSADRPPSPPWPSDPTFDSGYVSEDVEQGDDKDEEDGDKNSSHERSRRRRRSTHAYDLEEVCPSRSAWGRKTWAFDIYNKNVTILSKIKTTDERPVDQWFYETSCNRPEHRCIGIDNFYYESYCRGKYAWVYAMIRTEAGEEGWNWIRINASCNCAIRRRNHHGHHHRERCRVEEPNPGLKR